jgi:O-antigen ligase
MYRAVLLAMIVPCLVRWLSGKAGPIRWADVLLIAFALWQALCLIVNHGVAEALQSAGIGLIETIGAYMLARCYIRDADDFRNAVRLLFWMVVVLMPFAFIEFLGGGNILRKALGVILPVTDYPAGYRRGFTRVNSVFDHPILFGLHTGSIVALTYLVLGYQRSLALRCFKVGVVYLTAATSLSAGTIGAIALQVLLLSWNGVLRGMRGRWKLLIGLVLLLVVVTEIVAKRSALSIITQSIVIDAQTYWYRRLIWDYGTTSVLNHPLFGIGMHDWARPAWMPLDTIDNFWLVQAIRYGFPAPILLLLTGTLSIISIVMKKELKERENDFRMAYVITLLFFFMIGWTVHLWDSAYVLFLFVLGSGVWILDAQPAEAARAGAKVRPAALSGWSRARQLNLNERPVPATSTRRVDVPDEELSGEWRG